MDNALYLVATPIGNLDDISKRAIETLKSVDIIACEDTRTSQKLLNRFDIKNKTTAFHKYNTAEKTDEIINMIISGKAVALISDAGMPCISDPGQYLVNKARKSNIEIFVVPGPSAVVSAYASSGFEYKGFSFYGFLENDNKKREKELEDISNSILPSILYISPHKMKNTLLELKNHLNNREIFIIKEITKIYEKSMLTTIDEALKFYEHNTPKGEYVLIVKPLEEKQNEDMILALKLAEDMKKAGLSLSTACKITSKYFGVKKNQLYEKLKDD
ncbi:MAG: 16S rRNA (cytidine(1402)-2'-O)-methyltransferase [Clostridia bacterium]|nr:16S rRNA (cytidine(1402)-2'-O)-methyltransferase [Clostridia bacterium]